MRNKATWKKEHLIYKLTPSQTDGKMKQLKSCEKNINYRFCFTSGQVHICFTHCCINFCDRQEETKRIEIYYKLPSYLRLQENIWKFHKKRNRFFLTRNTFEECKNAICYISFSSACQCTTLRSGPVSMYPGGQHGLLRQWFELCLCRGCWRLL